MELFEEDFYRVEKNSISGLILKDLFELYQPLVGPLALSFFCTLFFEAEQDEIFRHSRLVKILKSDIDELLKARENLERYGLLKTYYSSDEKQYLYRLNSPVNSTRFMEHPIYGIQIKKELGLVEYNRTKSLYQLSALKGYKNVSNQLDPDILDSFNEEEVRDILTPKENTRVENYGFPSESDYRKFFAGISELTFPLSARTEENKNYIGSLYSYSNMSMDEFRKVVLNCIDMKTGVLDKDGLFYRITKRRTSTKKTMDYHMSPLDFLSQKLNNAPIAASSLSILEYLSNDLGYSNDIVNVLVEIVLDNNEGKFTKAYVDKVVETFGANNVKTLEDAINVAKKQRKASNQKVRRSRKIKEETVSSRPEISDEEDQKNREELMKLIEEMNK